MCQGIQKTIKLSVITVCKNSEKTIGTTILSVLSQDYSDIEYIVIDGKSTDGTVEVINKYTNKLAHFISEEDSGIYQAMNKGISAATGDYILFLNSDDRLISESTISQVVKKIIEHDADNISVFYGNIQRNNPVTGKSDFWKPKPLTKLRLFRGSLPHPATFYKREAFNSIGLFDESYIIAGDYEWLARAYFKYKLNIKYIDITVSVFSEMGISNDIRTKTLQDEERKRMFISNLSPSELKFLKFRRFFQKLF